MTSRERDDLLERLRYTFSVGSYEEIDPLLDALAAKPHIRDLTEEFFAGSSIGERGDLVPGPFFRSDEYPAGLLYAMYNLLGFAPDTFLLKHRVSRVMLDRRTFKGPFRIPRGLFRLPHLQYLYLTGIGLSRLPADLGRCRHLLVLGLRGNRLKSLPESVLALHRLALLDLSGNRLTSLPPAIQRLTALRILNLQANGLTSLPPEVGRLRHLRKLNVSMNALKKLPEGLVNLPELTELRAAFNDMEARWEATWELGVEQRARRRTGDDKTGSAGGNEVNTWT